MNGQSLGRLEKVDLRKYWENEAGDFTPWLAQEENIALLSNIIGIELEVEAQEKNVGPFRADILCKDTMTNNWVLIENQLNNTDHKHLGQLLTYAAGLDAVTIVWIADKFTDEHRAAIDWLNKITNDRFNFFGLEIELWKIGNSPMAPKFNVASQPNDWSRTISDAANKIQSGELSETNQLQLAYWTVLRDFLQFKKSIVKPQRPLPQNCTFFRIGRSYFYLVARVNSKDKRVAVYLVIAGPEKTAHFGLLYKRREEIEKDMGEPLDWRELPENKESQIVLRLNDVDITDKGQWPKQHEWLCNKLEAFHRVFSHRIKKLKASDFQLPEDNGSEVTQ